VTALNDRKFEVGVVAERVAILEARTRGQRRFGDSIRPIDSGLTIRAPSSSPRFSISWRKRAISLGEDFISPAGRK